MSEKLIDFSGEKKLCINCINWGAEGRRNPFFNVNYCRAIEGTSDNGAKVAGYDEEGIETNGTFGCIFFKAK